MCHASRCWGDVREKERLSRRLPAIADTPRHLPHKSLISFSVQGYVIQDKRAAQAVCGRNMAFQERRPTSQEDGGHGAHVQAALLRVYLPAWAWMTALIRSSIPPELPRRALSI